MKLPSIENLIVLSPHLDDAVFGCGTALAAARHAAVVTVFAGIPGRGMPLPDWDRRAGFSSAAQAMRVRRREDACAQAALNAAPVWLDFLDNQYGVPARADAIAMRIAQVLDGWRNATIVAPLGLFHDDHLLTHRAAMMLWRRSPREHAWLFYEDALYRRIDGLVQRRLAQWQRHGLVATPHELHLQRFTNTKLAAADAYASQLPLLGQHRLMDLHAPERYWHLRYEGPQ